MPSEPPAALLDGVYVANVTPFLDDDRFSIDLEAYLAHVEWLAGQGVAGIVPFGTNGEGPSIAAHEKRPVFEALVASTGDLQIIATVAEGNLPDTLDQLSFLQDLPVRAVLVMPPYYWKPVETEGLRVFYERVLAATRHPVVIYHIPKYAVPVPTDLVLSLPVWGVKDSGGEAGYAETVHAAGKGVLARHRGRPPGPAADSRRLDLRPRQHRARAGCRAVFARTRRAALSKRRRCRRTCSESVP